MNSKRNRGNTLAELMIAIVIASIVAIGFSSVLMYTQNMYNDSQRRVRLSHDAYIMDRYVRKNLTTQLSDSMKIYASSGDEDSGTEGSSGTILRSVRPDSTVDHLSVDGTTLVWTIDSVSHYPIDSEISNILFQRRVGYSKTILNINLDLVTEEDSLALEWLVSVRN